MVATLPLTRVASICDYHELTTQSSTG